MLGVITEGDASALTETVAELVILVDVERELLTVALLVRDRPPVPVEHTEPLPVFDTDTDPVPLTVPVEVFEAVVVDDPLVVDVVERVAESEIDAVVVALAWSVALAVLQPETLGLALPEPEKDAVPLSLNVRVARAELVTLEVVEVRAE